MSALHHTASIKPNTAADPRTLTVSYDQSWRNLVQSIFNVLYYTCLITVQFTMCNTDNLWIQKIQWIQFRSSQGVGWLQLGIFCWRTEPLRTEPLCYLLLLEDGTSLLILFVRGWNLLVILDWDPLDISKLLFNLYLWIPSLELSR